MIDRDAGAGAAQVRIGRRKSGERLDVLAERRGAHADEWTIQRLDHANVHQLAPASTVNVSKTATVKLPP